jgi:RHS repeat-associated protein
LKQYAGTHYKYDARSNLIEKQQGEQITKFSWDGFNRLSKISSQAGGTKYFYDVFGRRIGKANAQGKTAFIWDGDVIALEKTAEHTRHYLFEPNSFVPLAQIVSANDSEQEHTAYYHVDHLGTPQTLSDENGEIAWSAEYKAWGEAQVVMSKAAKEAGINNQLHFQGQYADEESGLHYNRYRYYDPEIGRFISSDPIGLMGGINTHAYAPNPVEWVDPFGLAAEGDYAQMPGIPGYQKHHNIPQSMANHPAIVNSGYDINNSRNITQLPNYGDTDPTRTVHRGMHTEEYNETVRSKLDRIENSSASPEIKKIQVQAVSDGMGDDLRNNRISLNAACPKKKKGTTR